jgi:hypothetical protein
VQPRLPGQLRGQVLQRCARGEPRHLRQGLPLQVSASPGHHQPTSLEVHRIDHLPAAPCAHGECMQSSSNNVGASCALLVRIAPAHIWALLLHRAAVMPDTCGSAGTWLLHYIIHPYAHSTCCKAKATQVCAAWICICSRTAALLRQAAVNLQLSFPCAIPCRCGDKFCHAAKKESAKTCPQDCPAKCGDGCVTSPPCPIMFCKDVCGCLAWSVLICTQLLPGICQEPASTVNFVVWCCTMYS